MQSSARNEAAQPWAQAVVLGVLFAVPALMAIRQSIVIDPDVWWHMKAGAWILQHHAVPHTDPFSIYGADKPWAAYSWLYEIVVVKLFTWLGLQGIVTYTAGMIALITAAVFRMNRRLIPDFTIAVLLTVVPVVCLLPVLTPRSWMFTILFFTYEIDVLMQSRLRGRHRELIALPLVFALWANIHVQFVVGLLVIGVTLAEAVTLRWWKKAPIATQAKPLALAATLAGCILATLVNPYGWKLYSIVAGYGSLGAMMNLVAELKSMPFRDPVEFAILFYAVIAACLIARARRAMAFEIIMLAFAMYVSFRSLRDVWVVVIVSAAVIASALKKSEKSQFRVTLWSWPVVPVMVVVAMLIGFRAMGQDNAALARGLAEALPVNAVEYVKSRNLPGPVFNDFGWGGYLIWSLGMPVEMDGRGNIYGDARVAQSVATWGGASGWNTNEDLRKANLVIGPVNAALTQLLRLSPCFQLVYEDRLAAVFVVRAGANPATGRSVCAGSPGPAAGPGQ
jgi:hypothetical protein